MKATKQIKALVEAGLTKEQAENIEAVTGMVGDDLKPLLRFCATLAVGSDNPVWADYALAIVRSGR